MIKWVAGGLGVIIGVAHIGVLGHLLNKNSLPTFVPPQVGPRTSYTVEATRDGYIIRYRGDDPTVMTEEIVTDQSNGAFGIGGRSTTTRTRQFTPDGQPVPGGADGEGGKLTAEQIACIEAAGGGRSSGAIVGGSIASGVLVPAVINIPYVGWLAAGWMTMLGTDMGGNIGAEVSQTISGC